MLLAPAAGRPGNRRPTKRAAYARSSLPPDSGADALPRARRPRRVAAPLRPPRHEARRPGRGGTRGAETRVPDEGQGDPRSAGDPFQESLGSAVGHGGALVGLLQSMLDSRASKCAARVAGVRGGVRTVFEAAIGNVLVYTGSGTGGWEATSVNTLSRGDRVLGCVTGHFSQ